MSIKRSPILFFKHFLTGGKGKRKKKKKISEKIMMKLKVFLVTLSSSVTLLDWNTKEEINLICTTTLWMRYVLFLLTCISAAAASPSPGVPVLSSPSLFPCGRHGKRIHPRNRWQYQMQHEDGHSSAGWPQPGHESLSPWEKTNQTAFFYQHCPI